MQIPKKHYLGSANTLQSKMRVFLDTEFTSLTQQAELMALALVTEEKDYFYAEFTDFDISALSDWHKTYILPSLLLGTEREKLLPPNGQLCKGSRSEVKESLLQWLASLKKPLQVWGDVPAYDWVLFCELFGGALHLPEDLHYIVRDLATLLESAGYDPDISRFAFAYGEEAPPLELPQHNALADAFASMQCLEKLLNAETISK